jgi:SsrA-binding protein
LFDALDNRDIIIKENFLEVSQLEKDNIKIMARNREAYHEYFVEEELEAGIELCGTEVKSIRLGNINMKDSWCGIKNGEMIVNQLHIAPYEQGNIFNRDSKRPRRLLLHKREIMRLFGKVKQDGYSIIPLSIYLKGSLVKVNIGLCKGKKLYDKRQAAAEKDAKRQIDRAMKERY